MALITAIAIVLVVLVVIGGGASGFFKDVSSGVQKVMSYVEKTPVLQNLTQETKQFVTQQGGQLAKEITGMFLVQNLYATGKGLNVDLEVASGYAGQDAEIDTFQDGEYLNTVNMFINEGTFMYGIQYEKGGIETGPFEVCVYLVRDDTESCGNGYNQEGKHPENVFVDLGGAYHELIEAPLPPEAQAQASTNVNTNENSLSQSQATTIYICKDGGACTPQ